LFTWTDTEYQAAQRHVTERWRNADTNSVNWTVNIDVTITLYVELYDKVLSCQCYIAVQCALLSTELSVPYFAFLCYTKSTLCRSWSPTSKHVEPEIGKSDVMSPLPAADTHLHPVGYVMTSEHVTSTSRGDVTGE